MSMSDPIADMLTRIRNGMQATMINVAMPTSKVKESIAQVLKQEGYLDGFSIEGEGSDKTLTIDLKYFQGRPVIEELKRISKPGCRVYAGTGSIPSVNNGLGESLISTSKGIMTGKAARVAGVGGEVICTVF
jgi:small subunit ribosomal protein S8